MGYDSNGYCVDSSKGCAANIKLSVIIKYTETAEIGGIIFSSIIGAFLYYYYFTVAKRLITLWA